MNRSLDAFIQVAKLGSDLRSQIYKKALPELEKLRSTGAKLEADPQLEQNQVFNFASRFVQLVDLPTNTAKLIGYYADGFDTMDRYKQADLQERMEAFSERFTSDPLDLANFETKKISKRLKRSLKSSFPLIILGETVIPETKFFFQYKYVFADSVVTIKDLIQTREAGVVFAGISRISDAPFDGQQGNAEAFLEHDLIHAFVQKQLDLQLFNKLGATDSQSAQRVKQQTNRLLQNRVSESDRLANHELRGAIEALQFVLLHEQARTYPLGVSEDLQSESQRNFYLKGTRSLAKDGLLGDEYAYLGDKPELLDEALIWIQTRADSDTKELVSIFK